MSRAKAQARNLPAGFNGFHASSRLSANDLVADVQLCWHQSLMSKRYSPQSYFLRQLTTRRDWYTPFELNRLLELMTDANPRNRDWATFYVALSVHLRS